MALDKSPASPDSCYDSGIDMLEFPTQKLSSKQLPIPQKPCTSEGQAPLSGCQGEVDSPLISPLSDTGIINLECPFDESRDLPSPPKRRRLKESGRVNKCLEHFGTCSRKLSFGDDGRTHEGEKQSHIKSGKEVERKDPRADYLKYSEGRDARLKRKIEQREMGKLSVALSNDHAGDIGSGTKHVDEMLDLAIRSIDLDRKISMVQRRKKSIEMSLMSLESFDVKEGAESIKAAQEALKVSETSGNYVESENFKRQLQSAKELKEEAEMSLKFLEKLSGEVEGACHDNFNEGGPSAVDTSSISASWDSESNVNLEKEPELMALEKKGEAVGDKCIEASPTLTGETLPPRDKMATHVAASSSHGNDAKKKSKHVSFKDSEDEIFDLPSSKLDHVSKDIPELQKTAEEENPTQSMSEASKLCRSIKKHLVVATGQNLMRDFIEIFHIDNESSEDGETCDDCIDEELVKETAEIVRRAMIHLDTEAFNDALQQASEAALGLTSENTKNTKSLPFKSPIKNKILANWAYAYPNTQIQASDLIRAIEMLVSLTKSTPTSDAMLKDTAESEYDALVVHIIYYLEMCTNAKCLEIIEGRKFCGREVRRVEVPSFGIWWKQVQEEMGGRVGEAWHNGVLNKRVLQSVNVDEGRWN